MKHMVLYTLQNNIVVGMRGGGVNTSLTRGGESQGGRGVRGVKALTHVHAYGSGNSFLALLQTQSERQRRKTVWFKRNSEKVYSPVDGDG